MISVIAVRVQGFVYIGKGGQGNLHPQMNQIPHAVMYVTCPAGADEVHGDPTN